MNRRDFLAVGAGAAAGGVLGERDNAPAALQADASRQLRPGAAFRDLFPRLEHETFLNAAAGTPLGAFTERGLRAYEDLWRLGPGDGRGEYFNRMIAETRAALARLIGAQPDEIAFVLSTKAGEQIVLDGLPALAAGANVVTNDLHFAGSLHNLVGRQRAGLDVRIVRARDWSVGLDAMVEAIDNGTALVAVTLVSNINGHFEPLRELADVAHAHGAHVYADVIQAVGIVPVDVSGLGIDFAAGNGYKWLFGPHGTGFLYVRRGLQGTALPDRLFPGTARHNYPPWIEGAAAGEPAFEYRAPVDATRYQPGHVNYLGYAALHAGLRLVEGVGVEAAQAHSVRLAQRLYDSLDATRYECISPHRERAPIITFVARDADGLAGRLAEAKIAVSLAGNRIRVSPAIFNDERDVDRLAEVLNRL